MAITREQAVTLRRRVELHYSPAHAPCQKRIGSRGGESWDIETVRVNGSAKTWERNPEAFSVPIKYGLRGFGYLTHENAHEFHFPVECEPIIEATDQATVPRG